MNRFDNVIFGQKAFILNKDRQILILKRDREEVYQNMWDVPGGKKEEEDGLRQALEREIFEETGLELKKILLTLTSHVFKGKAKDAPTVFRNIYLSTARGKVKLSHEHSEYKWIKPEGLVNYDFPKDIDFQAAIRTVINLAPDISLTESFSEVFNSQKVVVASTNPVKINTTEIGFAKMFPNVEHEFLGVKAESGVSDQPMSEEETLKGALNRAEHIAKLEPKADYWVGIEGGIQEINGVMESFAWIVIRDKKGKIGRGRSGSFILPPKVAKLIKQGKELGEADDIVFGMKNSKQSNGAVGILTGDVLTRTTFYEPAVILALIPFKNPKLF